MKCGADYAVLALPGFCQIKPDTLLWIIMESVKLLLLSDDNFFTWNNILYFPVKSYNYLIYERPVVFPVSLQIYALEIPNSDYFL
jgi:hypothetical protein